MSKSPHLSPTPEKYAEYSICIAILSLGTAAWLYYIWFVGDAAWLHPELLGTAVYIWNHPGQDSFAAMLRKVFDWKAFDPNVNRVRPLNDLMEVFDAVSRPYLARIFGPHPSAMPSAFLTLLLAPLFLFRWLRRSLGAVVPAVILGLLFVSSTGFLSDIVAYIRPAKKLNLIFLCMALYYAHRFSEGNRRHAFFAMYGCILASFFADELGLGNFVVIGVLYWREIFAFGPKCYRYLYLTLPVVFLLVTEFVLPAMYKAWGVHGAWNALADQKKFTVFAYLIYPEFYLTALQGLARSLLSTFAIGTHTILNEILALMVLFGAPLVHALRSGRVGLRRILEERFVLATVALALASFYATLLDWYPFPHLVSYLGSFNYYYHSSIVVLVIIWAAYALKNYGSWISSEGLTLRGYPAVILVTLGAGLVLTAYFRLFERVNQAVQIIHIYPYENGRLWASLRLREFREAGHPGPVQVLVVGNADVEAKRYEDTLKSIFGERWNGSYFYQVLGFIAPTPIMTPAHVAHLYTATYPWTKVSLTIEQQGVRGWGPHYPY